MQAVKNPVALNLANEVKKTVARNDVVNDTLNRQPEAIETMKKTAGITDTRLTELKKQAEKL